jgi:YidC/Oxa1 family membrane protein insertase
VLYVGSQLASTLLMSTTTDRTQRMIFLALPFVFVVFIFSFPAGLLVYWITTNLWTIVQQLIIRRRLGPMRPPGSEPGPGLGELLRGGGASGAPAAKTAGGDNSNPPKGKPSGPPPSPPRRKKKRSGRRR